LNFCKFYGDFKKKEVENKNLLVAQLNRIIGFTIESMINDFLMKFKKFLMAFSHNVSSKITHGL